MSHAAVAPPLKWAGTQILHGVTALRNGNPKSMGHGLTLTFVLASSTQKALAILETEAFAAIISDMGREEGPQEGYVLLEAVRAKDQSTPYFIYASSKVPEHQREAARRGAQGTTNVAGELVEMVAHAVRARA